MFYELIILDSKKEELRVYKIKLKNTIRMLENKNYDEKEIEVLNKRFEVYNKNIKRLEDEILQDNLLQREKTGENDKK